MKPLLHRKVGIEIKGANVGKGTGVKSYFLWAPTQTIAEVRSRPPFFALVFVRALMFEASSCALLTRFFLCRISSARCKLQSKDRSAAGYLLQLPLPLPLLLLETGRQLLHLHLLPEYPFQSYPNLEMATSRRAVATRVPGVATSCTTRSACRARAG